MYVGRIVEVVGSCRYCGWSSLQVCTAGSSISEWNHLKYIVHPISYGFAVVVFTVEWTELLLSLDGVVSGR